MAKSTNLATDNDWAVDVCSEQGRADGVEVALEGRR
jgi:hypothetical protein